MEEFDSKKKIMIPRVSLRSLLDFGNPPTTINQESQTRTPASVTSASTPSIFSAFSNNSNPRNTEAQLFSRYRVTHGLNYGARSNSNVERDGFLFKFFCIFVVTKILS